MNNLICPFYKTKPSDRYEEEILTNPDNFVRRIKLSNSVREKRIKRNRMKRERDFLISL